MTGELRDIFMKELRRRHRESETSSIVEGESHSDEAQELPFYIHSTDTIYKFLFSVTQPPSRLYQEVISLAGPGQLGSDHQKLACALSVLQRATYSAVNLRKMDLLWNSSGGLGLGKTLRKYGF